ncbi:MAG: PKD domain-containing protein [Bacteroidota bacterium]
MKKTFTLFFLLVVLLSFRPLMGQTDTDFWFAVPKVSTDHGWDVEQEGGRKFYFRFANLNLANTIHISMPANPAFDPIIVNMAPNEALTVEVTHLIHQLWAENPNQIYNRGIYIKAENLTTAYFEVGTHYNPDIFALKGKNAMGEEFFVPFQDHFRNGNYAGDQPYSGIYIVATQDMTTVTVTPTNDVFPGRPAGIPFDTILHRGQVIGIVPDHYTGAGQMAHNHLGGTRVTSDKPIAISTTDDSVWAQSPWGGCRDLIGDQIVPTNIIGTEYIAMKGRIGVGGSAGMPEFFYVTGTENDTQVFIDGNLETILQPGQTYRWQFTQQNHHISTTNPAYVYHVAGFGCEMGGAILPPINVCTGSTKVSFTRSKGESFFLNILVRAGAEDGFIFRGDGPNTVISAADFVAVPGTTNWLAAEFEMSANWQVPQGQASLIENIKDVFHLGIINGGPLSGTMYGYFSDFNELDVKANISNHGADYKACFGEPVQLVAQGGVQYQWHPPDFLDDPTSATPIALPDTNIKYTVTVSGACKMVDSTSVNIFLYGPANAAFTIDESVGCSPFDLRVINESFGLQRYSWNMGDGTVYTTGAEEFDHTYTNDTDDPIQRQITLIGRYSHCRDTMITHVTVNPEVIAHASADVVSGCAPLTVNFENLSQRADQYQWKFGDGSSSSEKDPVHQFHNFSDRDTVYTVELTAIAKTGCTDYYTMEVHVKPYIETGFHFDPPAHCSPYPVELTNTSYGASTNLWSFNNGLSFEEIPAQQFVHTFENQGNDSQTHNIWLIGENEYGCRDTLIRQVTVHPGITASFTPNVTEGCNPLHVEFTNHLPEDEHNYLWDFDENNGTSSEHSPAMLFHNPSYQDTAVFLVRLTATTDEFCQDYVEHEIRVYPKIKANFTFDYTSYCTPQEITFHNTSLGAFNNHWDFGDGTTSQTQNGDVSHVFVNTTGSEIIYPVQLIIENENGCTDTLVRNVTIYPQIMADFDMVTAGCHPLEVHFENLSAGASNFFWDFGDGGSSSNPEPTRTYTNNSHLETETYQVKLLVESQFGCIDSLTREVNVFPKPNASYEVSQEFGCAPLYTDFFPTSFGAQLYEWDFGDGSNEVTSTDNVAHTYFNNNDTAQTITSRLIALNQHGCADTTYRSVEVFPQVTASIHITEPEGCHPFTANIVNLSEGATASTPYYWSYGDGNQSTDQQISQDYLFENFSHTETEFYTVKLRAESGYGCKDTTQTIVAVHPRPAASFEPLVIEGCSPLEVTFADNSVGALHYQWNFGDGNMSQESGNATHIFHQPHDAGQGLFPVELLVTNQFGCADTTYNQITVFPEITADFEVQTSGCHPLQVQFSNLSLGYNTLDWTFGDGSTSSHTDPDYTFTNSSYTENQYYTVQLNTQSVFGCEATSTQQITVHPKPFSAFYVSDSEGCAPFTVQIDNQSVGGTQFNWNLGGSQNQQSLPQFNHTFNNLQETPQTYQLHLVTTNEYGCWRESFQDIEVFPQVDADFTADNDQMQGCNPLPLNFENLSQRAHAYNWNFDDGNSSTIPNPFNEFYTPATHESTYNISLRAESVYGCTDSIVKQAKVIPVPMADFYVSPYEQTYPSTEIRVDNLSAPGNWNFRWDMGDGTIINTQSWEAIEHEYQFPPGDYATQQYRIGLDVSNGFCEDSIAQTVTIHAPMPVVGFAPSSQGCPPLEVQFRNESLYGLEYFWDFDDGVTSHQENPSHIFWEPGEYNVKLVVSGEGGIDSTYQTITVFELPRADFRVSPPVVQLPYEKVKMINLSSLAAFYEWHMGDGTIYYDFEPEHMYREPGHYDIRLNVATDTYPQCYNTLLKQSAVVAEENCMIIFPDAFTPNTSGPGDGSYIINDPANHVFYPIHTGLADYTLEIFNRWGEFIFRSTDVEIGWDGYFQGKLSPMDVYVWKVRATCHSGKKIEAAGDVTLYR